MRTITARFDSRAEAERAVEALVQEYDIDRSRIHVHATAEENASARTMEPRSESHHGFSSGDERGGITITAEVQDHEASQAIDALRRRGAIGLDARDSGPARPPSLRTFSEAPEPKYRAKAEYDSREARARVEDPRHSDTRYGGRDPEQREATGLITGGFGAATAAFRPVEGGGEIGTDRPYPPDYTTEGTTRDRLQRMRTKIRDTKRVAPPDPGL